MSQFTFLSKWVIDPNQEYFDSGGLFFRDDTITVATEAGIPDPGTHDRNLLLRSSWHGHKQPLRGVPGFSRLCRTTPAEMSLRTGKTNLCEVSDPLLQACAERAGSRDHALRRTADDVATPLAQPAASGRQTAPRRAPDGHPTAPARVSNSWTIPRLHVARDDGAAGRPWAPDTILSSNPD